MDILSILTSLENVPIRTGPAASSLPDGGFQDLLLSLRSIKEEGTAQNPVLEDQGLLSILLSVCQAPVLLSQSAQGSVQSASSAITATSDPVQLLLADSTAPLADVEEKTLPFDGSIVVPDRLNSLTATPEAEPGAAALVPPPVETVLRDERIEPPFSLQTFSPDAGGRESGPVTGDPIIERSVDYGPSFAYPDKNPTGSDSVSEPDPGNVKRQEPDQYQHEPKEGGTAKPNVSTLDHFEKSTSTIIRAYSAGREQTSTSEKEPIFSRLEVSHRSSPEDKEGVLHALRRDPHSESSVEKIPTRSSVDVGEDSAFQLNDEGGKGFTKSTTVEEGRLEFTHREAGEPLQPAVTVKGETPGNLKPEHEPISPRTDTLTDSLDVLRQIRNRMTWSARNGEERIKLELDPPQMGNLYVEIHRQKDSIQATFWTSNPVTKEVLESHRAELQRIFKEDGFQLGQFDVFVGQDPASFQDHDDRQVERSRWTYVSREIKGPPSGEEERLFTPGTPKGLRGSQHIDLFI